VYAFNTTKAVTDATIILPTDAWGMEYYRLSYTPVSLNYDYDVIIAKEDGTTVTLPSTTPFTLNEGEAYRVGLTGDQTGRHITATKPIAYFTHNSHAKVPTGQNAADILLEQMAPVTQWGKKFLVPNAYENTNTDSKIEPNLIRIIASVSGTKVRWSGAAPVDATAGTAPTTPTTSNVSHSGATGITKDSCTLTSPGSWITLKISGTVDYNPSSYISAEQPVGVAAYMTGSHKTGNDHNGDPSIAWIPALNQSVQETLISPFMFPAGYATDNTYLGQSTGIHYMIIIAPTGKETLTTVNGSSAGSGFPFRYQNSSKNDITGAPGDLPVDAKLNGGALNSSDSWKINAESGYSYYVWRFTNPVTGDNKDYLKTFKVENPYGVIVLAGGVGNAESYYYTAGSGTCGGRP
jgi:hypothetical protein